MNVKRFERPRNLGGDAEWFDRERRVHLGELEDLKAQRESLEWRLGSLRRFWEKQRRLQSMVEFSNAFVKGAQPVVGDVAEFSIPPNHGVAPRTRNVFCKSGCVWKVVYDGNPAFHIEEALGASYLDYLLHHANRPISAYDLEIAVNPEKAKKRAKDSIQSKTDRESVKQCLGDLEKLRAEREVAREEGDQAETGRLDAELEVLEDSLKGQESNCDNGERARSNVTKAIGKVIRKLRKGEGPEKAFARHLEQFVDRGFECIYNHDGQPWG